MRPAICSGQGHENVPLLSECHTSNELSSGTARTHLHALGGSSYMAADCQLLLGFVCDSSLAVGFSGFAVLVPGPPLGSKAIRKLIQNTFGALGF